MKKDNFQPIVMPCTKEQYETLLPILREHLYEDNLLNCVHDVLDIRYSFVSITNNHDGDRGNVSINTESIDDSLHVNWHNRKVYKRFNRKIFLASLGISDSRNVQSLTNKQTKMKSTIEETPEVPVKFKRGDIVKHVNQIYIVTETSPTTCDLLCVHPSHVHGMKQTSINNVCLSLFKGKLTLEQ